MLRISPNAMFVVAIAFVVAGIAIGGFAIFLQMGNSMSTSQIEHQGNNQQEPSAQKDTATPKSPESNQEKSNYWASAKQKIKDGWHYFVEGIHNNEKVVVALSTLVIAMFTIVLAIATGFLFWSSEKVAEAALKQAEASGKQVVAMQGQLDEIKRQSNAIERSSTAGRAYVFAKIPIPNHAPITKLPPLQLSLTLDFAIENFGQTPAVITKLETHILLAKSPLDINDAPEPHSTAFFELIENSKHPASSQRADLLLTFNQNGRDPIVIPANSQTIPLRQMFLFRRPLQVESPIVPNSHGAWFYCSISYKDIFGFERETVYYVGMFGAGIQLPKNPNYNRWN